MPARILAPGWGGFWWDTLIDPPRKKGDVSVDLDENPLSWLIEGPAAGPEALSRSSVLNKVVNYLLDAEKSNGKFGIFEKALGFTKETGGLLAKQIVFDASKAVDAGATQYGQKFTQVMTVTGTNGRKMEILTVWLKSAKDNVVRFVSAYPAK